MKVLVFATSLRKKSINKKFIENARMYLAQQSNVEVEKINLEDFDMPVYNEDIEAQAIPDSVHRLSDLIKGADAVVISTPEYNGSIPGVFKNMLDWTSRLKPHAWTQKPVLLLGASPGALGAIRGLLHTRQPLEVLGTYLYPEMFGLQSAGAAFDDKDVLVDPKNKERLNKLLDGYLNYAKNLIKK